MARVPGKPRRGQVGGWMAICDQLWSRHGALSAGAQGPCGQVSGPQVSPVLPLQHSGQRQGPNSLVSVCSIQACGPGTKGAASALEGPWAGTCRGSTGDSLVRASGTREGWPLTFSWRLKSSSSRAICVSQTSCSACCCSRATLCSCFCWFCYVRAQALGFLGRPRLAEDWTRPRRVTPVAPKPGQGLCLQATQLASLPRASPSWPGRARHPGQPVSPTAKPRSLALGTWQETEDLPVSRSYNSVLWSLLLSLGDKGSS